jgi:electron transfer flavoprotein beta subunit
MTMEFLVALKWSALRVEVDPLTGAPDVLPGRFGLDPASAAALEWARRLAGSQGAAITAVTVGPEEADAGLRIALGLGADRAVRVDGPAAAAPADLAAVLADEAAGADLVLTGAWSTDGRSAAAAPTLAALLGRSQACGLLSLEWDEDTLLGERRLPAGRRERIRIGLPAVVSMEAGTLPPRRAALPDLLAAAETEIPVVAPASALASPASGTIAPYRPRPRTVPPPPEGETPRERIAHLTGAMETGADAQVLRADPDEAAAAIVEALRRWGYLGDGEE